MSPLKMSAMKASTSGVSCSMPRYLRYRTSGCHCDSCIRCEASLWCDGRIQNANRISLTQVVGKVVCAIARPRPCALVYLATRHPVVAAKTDRFDLQHRRQVTFQLGRQLQRAPEARPAPCGCRCPAVSPQAPVCAGRHRAGVAPAVAPACPPCACFYVFGFETPGRTYSTLTTVLK